MFTAKEFKSKVKSGQENAIKAMEQFIDDSLKTAVDNGLTKDIMVIVPHRKEHASLLDDLLRKYTNQGNYNIVITMSNTQGTDTCNTYRFNLKETTHER